MTQATLHLVPVRQSCGLANNTDGPCRFEQTQRNDDILVPTTESAVVRQDKSWRSLPRSVDKRRPIHSREPDPPAVSWTRAPIGGTWSKRQTRRVAPLLCTGPDGRHGWATPDAPWSEYDPTPLMGRQVHPLAASVIIAEPCNTACFTVRGGDL
jgi:hypothetical protein